MLIENFPTKVQVSQVPAEGIKWDGIVPVSFFSRIDALNTNATQQDPECQNVSVSFNLKPSTIKGDLYELTVTSLAHCQLECQRCLQDVTLPLEVDTHLYLVSQQEDENLLDEESDCVLISDFIDDTVAKQIKNTNARYAYELPEFNLAKLIEDELLLTLPLSPMHDDCELAVESFGEIEPVTEEEENPFAMLAGLKGKL